MVVRVFVVLLGVILGCISPSWTVASHKPHIVAVYTDWKPYGYYHEGKAQGFEIEVFREVAERIGATVEFQNCPWKRCLKMVEKGKADVLNHEEKLIIDLKTTSDIEKFSKQNQ